MIPLYIVLYLVVGLIVKWLMERNNGELSFDNSLLTILFYPIIPIVFIFICIVVVFDEIIEKATFYTRIRKFFRGF